MKSRVIWVVLAVTGILALTAPAAQAGEGGRPFPLTSFFVCHQIKADAPPPEQSVDVDSSVFGANPQNVKIGIGTLACVVAKLFHAGSDHTDPANEIQPQPNSVNQEGVKCYTISGPRQSPTPGVPDSYTVIDELFGEDPDVQAYQIPFYICTPANFRFNP